MTTPRTTGTPGQPAPPPGPARSTGPTTEPVGLCLLCAQPMDTWPCGVSWDAEHRPMARG